MQWIGMESKLKIKTEILVYSFKNTSEEVQKLEDCYIERRNQIILLYFDCNFESGKFAHVFQLKGRCK